MLRKAIGQDTTCRHGCTELAYFLNGQGRLPEAADLLERALAQSPSNRAVEQRLSVIRMKLGSFDLAVPHIAHLAATRPTEDNLVVLAIADLAVQRQRDGITALEDAARLYPKNAEIQRLGVTLHSVQQSPEAIPHLKELALSLSSGLE
jgi:tetratricopeptide (TPR) repeat protein